MYRQRKNKHGMQFLGTLMNCLTPSVAPEHPQFSPPTLFAEGETEARTSRADQGPAGSRGSRPLASETGPFHTPPGACHPPSE